MTGLMWVDEVQQFPETTEVRGKIMPTRLTRLIQVTNDKGELVLDDDIAYEPLPSSIILTEGVHGTAWQRWHGDGLWHRSGSTQKKDWSYMLTKRNVVLVYDAPERKAG